MHVPNSPRVHSDCTGLCGCRPRMECHVLITGTRWHGRHMFRSLLCCVRPRVHESALLWLCMLLLGTVTVDPAISATSIQRAHTSGPPNEPNWIFSPPFSPVWDGRVPEGSGGAPSLSMPLSPARAWMGGCISTSLTPSTQIQAGVCAVDMHTQRDMGGAVLCSCRWGAVQGHIIHARDPWNLLNRGEIPAARTP